jgi:hypothetical protein
MNDLFFLIIQDTSILPDGYNDHMKNYSRGDITADSPSSISSISSEASSTNSIPINTKSAIKNSMSAIGGETRPPRKKNSFDIDLEGEISDDYYGRGGGGGVSAGKKKEFYLRDPEDRTIPKKWPSNNDLTRVVTNQMADLNTNSDSTSLGSSPGNNGNLPKSSLKSGSRKQGVTFVEKLDVYEVKNPHYGQEVKSEKYEMKQKKREKKKEENIIFDTKEEARKRIKDKYTYIHYYVIL